MLLIRQAGYLVAFVGLATTSSFGQEVIPEILVTGRRLSPSVNEPAYLTSMISRGQLDLSAGARLDDALRAVPGFGLFRRQSSRASHPTTQGVTLRGLGPSGAGRTLVLLDGIPQNDPFGGWIDWSRIPTASLESAALTRGSGAGPWGNSALAGVIRLQSREVDRNGGFAEANFGPNETYDATAGVQGIAGNSAWHGYAHGHHADGSFLIRKNQRGSIDRRARDRGAVGELGARFAINDDTVIRGTARYSESSFINGITAALSTTRVTDAALSVLHDAGAAASWEVNAYVRDQDFKAIFVAVNAARSAATLSLDQFSVPTNAQGGNAILRYRFDDQLTVDAGADVRAVDGATNENFQNQGAGFTRVRKAGGEQVLAGTFAELNWQPNDTLLATIGGRIDWWQQNDGIRRESVLQGGAIVRDDKFADRDGNVSTVRAGLNYSANDRVAIRAAAYTGFRLPTLNELYRPFRVGNDITEANPALGIERLQGLDLGVEWAPADDIKLSATYFHSVLKNAVANVTVRATPGLDPGLGIVVPAGGVLRQRRNLDRIVADGLEGEFTANVTPEVQFSLRYLYTSPNVTRSPQQPALKGLRLAQVAKHQGSAQVTWSPSESVSLSASARGTTNQFDDDLNSRILRGYAVADFTAEAGLTEQMRLVFAVENAFNRTIEAGRSADGLVSVGTPRTARLGLRANF